MGREGKGKNKLRSRPKMASAINKLICPAAINRPELGDGFDALKAKEKEAWTTLSNEDKIAIYRAQFPQTLEESFVKEPEGAKITAGIFMGLSVALLFFAFLKEWVGPEAPHTITPEWRAAQEEKMRLYRMNPITGVSSK